MWYRSTRFRLPVFGSSIIRLFLITRERQRLCHWKLIVRTLRSEQFSRNGDGVLQFLNQALWSAREVMFYSVAEEGQLYPFWQVITSDCFLWGRLCISASLLTASHSLSSVLSKRNLHLKILSLYREKQKAEKVSQRKTESWESETYIYI